MALTQLEIAVPVAKLAPVQERRRFLELRKLSVSEQELFCSILKEFEENAIALDLLGSTFDSQYYRLLRRMRREVSLLSEFFVGLELDIIDDGLRTYLRAVYCNRMISAKEFAQGAASEMVKLDHFSEEKFLACLSKIPIMPVSSCHCSLGHPDCDYAEVLRLAVI